MRALALAAAALLLAGCGASAEEYQEPEPEPAPAQRDYTPEDLGVHYVQVERADGQTLECVTRGDAITCNW